MKLIADPRIAATRTHGTFTRAAFRYRRPGDPDAAQGGVGRTSTYGPRERAARPPVARSDLGRRRQLRWYVAALRATACVWARGASWRARRSQSCCRSCGRRTRWDLRSRRRCWAKACATWPRRAPSRPSTAGCSQPSRARGSTPTSRSSSPTSGLDIGPELALENASRHSPSQRDRKARFASTWSSHGTSIARWRSIGRLQYRYDCVGFVLQSYLYRSEGDLARDAAALAERAHRQRRLPRAARRSPFRANATSTRTTSSWRELRSRHEGYTAIATHDPRIIARIEEFDLPRAVCPSAGASSSKCSTASPSRWRSASSSADYRVRLSVPYGSILVSLSDAPPCRTPRKSRRSSSRTRLMLQMSVTGIWAAALTPVDAALQPDSRRGDAVLSRAAGGGCDGVNVLGTTGEAMSFSADQRCVTWRRIVAGGLPLRPNDGRHRRRLARRRGASHAKLRCSGVLPPP